MNRVLRLPVSLDRMERGWAPSISLGPRGDRRQVDELIGEFVRDHDTDLPQPLCDDETLGVLVDDVLDDRTEKAAYYHLGCHRRSMQIDLIATRMLSKDRADFHNERAVLVVQDPVGMKRPQSVRSVQPEMSYLSVYQIKQRRSIEVHLKDIDTFVMHPDVVLPEWWSGKRPLRWWWPPRPPRTRGIGS